MLDTLAAPGAVSVDFDLLYQPWIPVLALDGAPQEVGLLDCLGRAPELREVAEASPLVTFSIYRFLAAVLHAYMPIGDEDAWAAAWDQGRFDQELLDRVRKGCAGRLRLFDTTHPFYQSADVPLPAPGDRRALREAKTAGYLYPEASTGTNVVHFSHPGDSAHAFCPACCARGLVALTPFATSGGAGIKPSINGVPPIYVLPGGQCLFETLLLNYALPAFRPKLAASSDPGPLWTGNGIVPKQEERAQVGFLESLTWSPRRARLFPGDGGRCSRCARQSPLLVRRMAFAQGLSRQKSLPPWDDPWVAFRHKSDKAPGAHPQRTPILPRPGRDVWRDFGALFLAKTGNGALRPAILQQLDLLLSEELLPAEVPLRFETFAVRTDMKMKFFEYQQQLFEFPPALLCRDPMATVEDALRHAEAAARCLARALRQLHPVASRKAPDPKALRAALAATVEGAARGYWQDLELHFRHLIADSRLLQSMAQQNLWLEEWRKAVRESAVRVFEATLDAGGFDADADALLRQETCRRTFYQTLALALKAGGGGDQETSDDQEEMTEEDDNQ